MKKLKVKDLEFRNHLEGLLCEILRSWRFPCPICKRPTLGIPYSISMDKGLLTTYSRKVRFTCLGCGQDFQEITKTEWGKV